MTAHELSVAIDALAATGATAAQLLAMLPDRALREAVDTLHDTPALPIRGDQLRAVALVPQAELDGRW